MHDLSKLKELAKQHMAMLKKQYALFPFPGDQLVEKAFGSLSNSDLQSVGPELIFGSIFDYIGFGEVDKGLLRHLVISRLAFPLSKLKTVEYLARYQGIQLDADAVYRFLDKLNNKLKAHVEQIAYRHTVNVLQGKISVVFYDMTTLHFEASDEDDLRKMGFSKAGKHHRPQILIGLLVGPGGYAIGYDIFEGNTYEGHTLMPFLEKIKQKFDLEKPIVVADAGLLSKDNVIELDENNYYYILGARLKNEPEAIKGQILSLALSDGQTACIKKNDGQRLIIHYSDKRAKKDAYNRKRGLERLEKKVKQGRLTKSSINNRGYNKYLQLRGEVMVEIDYAKYEADARWDGLKGFVTNAKLNDSEVVENYGCLWYVERAFRMSKTDLAIRPVFHRLRQRIEAHICIAFIAYVIYKELERVLKLENAPLSLKKASEITHNMYQITYTLPESKQTKVQLLKMNSDQQLLIEIIQKYFRVLQR